MTTLYLLMLLTVVVKTENNAKVNISVECYEMKQMNHDNLTVTLIIKQKNKNLTHTFSDNRIGLRYISKSWSPEINLTESGKEYTMIYPDNESKNVKFNNSQCRKSESLHCTCNVKFACLPNYFNTNCSKQCYNQFPCYKCDKTGNENYRIKNGECPDPCNTSECSELCRLFIKYRPRNCTKYKTGENNNNETYQESIVTTQIPSNSIISQETAEPITMKNYLLSSIPFNYLLIITCLSGSSILFAILTIYFACRKSKSQIYNSDSDYSQYDQNRPLPSLPRSDCIYMPMADPINNDSINSYVLPLSNQQSLISRNSELVHNNIEECT